LHVEPWSAGILILFLLRRPGAGALLAGLRLAVLRRRLARGAPHPPLLAAELLALALLGTARGASHAIRRTWSPLLIPAGRAQSHSSDGAVSFWTS